MTALYRPLGDVRELVFWVASAGQVLVLADVLLGLYATLSARAPALAALQALAMLLVGFAAGIVAAMVFASFAAGILTERLGLAVNTRLMVSDFWPLAVMLAAGALSVGLVAWRAYAEPLSDALRS